MRGLEGLPPHPPAFPLPRASCSSLFSGALGGCPLYTLWELSWAPTLDKGSWDTRFRESSVLGSSWFLLCPGAPRTLSCLK